MPRDRGDVRATRVESQSAQDAEASRTDHDDAALVVSIGRYQQAALAEAYRRHAGATFGLAKRLLNDHARAEERGNFLRSKIC